MTLRVPSNRLKNTIFFFLVGILPPTTKRNTSTGADNFLAIIIDKTQLSEKETMTFCFYLLGKKPQ